MLFIYLRILKYENTARSFSQSNVIKQTQKQMYQHNVFLIYFAPAQHIVKNICRKAWVTIETCTSKILRMTIYLWLLLSTLIHIILYVSRFSNDIYEMTGYRPGIYWQVTWRYVGPFIVSCILLSSLVFMLINPPTYGAWNADEVRHQVLLGLYLLV